MFLSFKKKKEKKLTKVSSIHLQIFLYISKYTKSICLLFLNKKEEKREDQWTFLIYSS